VLWKKDWLNSNMKSSFIVTSSKQNYKPFRNQPLGELYLSTILEQHFKDQLDVSMIDLRCNLSRSRKGCLYVFSYNT